MPREAALFDSADGNLLIAFLALCEEGVSIPPAWLERSRESRTKREKELGGLLKSGKLAAANYINYILRRVYGQSGCVRMIQPSRRDVK